MCQREFKSFLQDFKSDLMMKWSHDQILNYTISILWHMPLTALFAIVFLMYNFEI